MNNLDEVSLIKLVSIGDEMAFSEFYQIYKPLIYRFVNKFLKSTDLSDEVCQDVFIKIWEKKKDLLEIQSIKPYLFTVAKHQTLNMLKRSTLDQTIKANILSAYRKIENATENDIYLKEYMAYVEEVLNSLSPQSREVFRLCRQQGKSYDEAAQHLGVSKNAIKKHMVKSMKTLKIQIEKEFGLSLSVLLVVLYGK